MPRPFIRDEQQHDTYRSPPRSARQTDAREYDNIQTECPHCHTVFRDAVGSCYQCGASFPSQTNR